MGNKRWLIVGSVFLSVIIGIPALIWYFWNTKRLATEHFQRFYLCPAEQIEIRSRSDLKPSQLKPHEPPPADIQADPARYALWKKQDDKRLEMEDGDMMMPGYMYEVRGCGHHVLLFCNVKPSCKEYPL